MARPRNLERDAMNNKRKKAYVRSKGTSIHFEIAYEGGGEVPDQLKGLYTSRHKAEQELMLFQHGKN